MNRVSKRTAADAAEALLEVGRKQPALDYDVELGLARHQHWMHSDASMPEWASASLGVAAKSSWLVVIKTIVSAMLVGTLAIAAWYARDRLQPQAAHVTGAERALPSAPSEAEALLAPKPIPVPVEVLSSDQPVRRAVHADAPDKRTARLPRAHKQPAPARTASVHAEPALARAEPAQAAPATTPASEPRAIEPEPARKPISAAQKPGPRAQAPDDLLEMQQVATAEQLLERSPERALALVRQGNQRFARGYFQQERAYIAIMALIRLGRVDEARAQASSFAKQFPALPYAARIRSALEARAAE